MKGEKMYCRIKSLTDKKSIRRCAEELGISPTTVQKYAAMDMKEAVSYFTTRTRRSQFDRALGFILDTLEGDHRISAVKLHRKVTQRHPEITAGVRAFRDYIRPLRKRFKNRRIRHYEPVLDMKPGKQLQVDGGEITVILQSSDQKLKVYFMVFVLSYSRMMYVSFQTHPYTTSDFITSHLEAFSYFGGIAAECVYDQTKLVAIAEEYREVLYNNEFYRFAMKCGFTPHVCAGYDPESKGKVERAIGYVKDSFFCGERFTGIEGIRSKGTHWLNTVANIRTHATTKRTPVSMFQKERKHLLTANFLNQASMFPRLADKTGLISFKGNKYSVPFQYQRTQVMVRTEEKTVVIYDQRVGKRIASHTIASTKGNIIINNNHYRNYKKTVPQLLSDTEKAFADISCSAFIISCVRKNNPKIVRDQLRGLQTLRKQYKTEVWEKAAVVLQTLPVLSCSRIKAVLERIEKKQHFPKVGSTSNRGAWFYTDTDCTPESSRLDRSLDVYLKWAPDD